MARDGWGVDDIRQRCLELKAVLVEWPEVCTPAEVDAYWPGGSENNQPGRGGWIYCYSQLCALLRRSESIGTVDDRTHAIAEQAARDAARGIPEVVDLDEVDEHGIPKQLAVHPKSFHALCSIEGWDDKLADIQAEFDNLRRRDSPAMYATYGEFFLEKISHYHRLMVWVLHHKDPGLPFDDHETPPPPSWTTNLSPLDIIRILRAHQVVNGARLGLALQLIKPAGPGQQQRRLSWATLLPVAAKELGVPLRTVTRDMAFEAVVAQMALAREAERQAEAQAKPVGPTLPDML